MMCGLSCYSNRGNPPVCELAGGGYVSIKERVTFHDIRSFFLWMNGEDLNDVWIELLQQQRKSPCM
jgi:hypothetical protein